MCCMQSEFAGGDGTYTQDRFIFASLTGVRTSVFSKTEGSESVSLFDPSVLACLVLVTVNRLAFAFACAEACHLGPEAWSCTLGT